MKIPFGYLYQLDPSEYRDGTAASVRDCYRVAFGDEEDWTKRPGLIQRASNSSNNPSQGRYETFGNKVLEVIGGIVYEHAYSGTLTAYSGPFLNTSNQCVFAEDFSNVFIAHGGRIAKVDTTAKTVSLLGGNSPNYVTHIAFAKGFLLSNGLVSGGVAGDTNFSDDAINGYSAAASWETFNNERLPDGCNALVTGWDDEVYAAGDGSIEVSYNDGVTPWSVLQGAYIEYGCKASYSFIKIDNTLFWLTVADGARRIVKMVERSPQIISTPFDRLINEFDTVSDAIAWPHSMNGQSFYVITFPSANKTFAFKLIDQTWSELAYYNSLTASYERYKGTNGLYVKSWNKMVIGDKDSGVIYEQGGKTDNGNAIRMELTSGNNEFGTKKFKKESMLYFRVKRGYAEGGTFEYRVRDDQGQWKNEKSVSLGSLGDTNPYIKKTSGGVFRSRQYQIIHSDVDTEFVFMTPENDIQGTGR